MPTLEELFKNKVITEGPNTGKTAEDAYAIRNSKDLPVQSSNFLLRGINKNTNPSLLGGVIKSFDFIGKINERRKKFSVKEGESFIEQEQVGLQQFAITARPLIYGGDIFRILNKRTTSLSYIKQKANLNNGLSGITDTIANAAGNMANDYINNLFAGKRGKDARPPAPDLTAIGTQLAVNAAGGLLGSILPMPMVPSKVAEELQTRGKAGSGNKATDFNREYNRDKAIITLANSSKVPGFFANLLKENKNILSQTGGVIQSTVAGIASGLVKSGVRSLINLGVNAVTKKKIAANKLQAAGGVPGKTPLGKEDTPWSSYNPYGKSADYETTRPLSEQTTLKAIFLQRVAEELKADPNIKLPASSPATPQKQADEDLLNFINKEPKSNSSKPSVANDSRDNRRGLTTKGDVINLSDDAVYDGVTVIDTNTQKSFDDFDFIALKFYSVGLDKTVQFRCTVTDFTETFTPSWETHKFIGNPFPFYTYDSVERTCTFSFKVFSLNLVEHMNVWKKLDFLGKLTMPQEFKGAAGAVVPPIIQFTLGDLYVAKPAIVETLSFAINQDSPWEIGLNSKIANGTQMLPIPNVAGYAAFVEKELVSTNHKLPMIMDIDVSLKFLESRQTIESSNLYGYELPTTYNSVDFKTGQPVPPNYTKV
jgi:hypothetical protein